MTDYTALTGLPQSTTAPLQRVLNTPTRVVRVLRPRDPVTDALPKTFSLHAIRLAAPRV